MVMMVNTDSYDEIYSEDVDEHLPRQASGRDQHSAPSSSSLHTSSRHCICGAEHGDGSSSSSIIPEDFPISVKLRMFQLLAQHPQPQTSPRTQGCCRGSFPVNSEPKSSRECVFQDCCSEESEDDGGHNQECGYGGEEHELTCPYHPKNSRQVAQNGPCCGGQSLGEEADRSFAILRLLQEIMQLVSLEPTGREDSCRMPKSLQSGSSPDHDTCMRYNQPVPHPYEPTVTKKSQTLTCAPTDTTTDADADTNTEEDDTTNKKRKKSLGITLVECSGPGNENVCPMHGPKEPKVMVDAEVCVCMSKDNVCPIHGPHPKPAPKVEEYDPCKNCREYAMCTLPAEFCDKYPPIWGTKPDEEKKAGECKCKKQEADAKDTEFCAKYPPIWGSTPDDGNQDQQPQQSPGAAAFGKSAEYCDKYPPVWGSTPEQGGGEKRPCATRSTSTETPEKKSFVASCAVFGKWLMYMIGGRFIRGSGRSGTGAAPCAQAAAPCSADAADMQVGLPADIEVEECMERFNPCTHFGEYILCALSQKIFGHPEAAFEMEEDGRAVGECGETDSDERRMRTMQTMCARILNRFLNEDAKTGQDEIDIQQMEPDANYCIKLGDYIIGLLNKRTMKSSPITSGCNTSEGAEADCGKKLVGSDGGGWPSCGEEEQCSDARGGDVFYDCNDTSELDKLGEEEQCNFCDMVHDYIRDLAEGRDPDERLMQNLLQEQSEEPDEDTECIDDCVKISDMDECEECDCCFCRSRTRKLSGPCGRSDGEGGGGDGGDQLDQMKIFIETLICDLEAMQYVRCQREPLGYCENKNDDYKNADSACGYPATITLAEELGSSSLYVKWEVRDRVAIGGFEIYVDGQLKNRYYNGSHKAAVITNVDVSTSHKICLVAQPCNSGDVLVGEDFCPNIGAKSRALPPPEGMENMESICATIKEMNAAKALCKPPANTSNWTPSVVTYTPCVC